MMTNNVHMAVDGRPLEAPEHATLLQAMLDAGLDVPHYCYHPKLSIIDARTTRHPGYLISQQKRKRIEEIFCWLKTVAGLRKTRHRGLARVGWMFIFALEAYNLVRTRNLEAAAA